MYYIWKKFQGIYSDSSQAGKRCFRQAVVFTVSNIAVV